MSSHRCTIVESFNSGLAVGTVFKSCRDVIRTMPRGVGVRVGIDMGNGQLRQLRRTERMVFIEPLDRPNATSNAGPATTSAPVARLARPGRTSWIIDDPRTSGLNAQQMFSSKVAVARAMACNSSAVARDLQTGAAYTFSRANGTYSVVLGRVGMAAA